MRKWLAIFFLMLLLSACGQAEASSAAGNEPAKGTAAQSSDALNETAKEPMAKTLYITVNGKKISATLVDNSSTKALVEKLAAGPVTYEAHDYGDFEKVGELPWSLPRNDENITTVPGDLILYLGKNFVIYYDTNQWDFTRIGRVDGKSQAELKTFLNAGKGNVKITLSLE